MIKNKTVLKIENWIILKWFLIHYSNDFYFFRFFLTLTKRHKRLIPSTHLRSWKEQTRLSLPFLLLLSLKDDDGNRHELNHDGFYLLQVPQWSFTYFLTKCPYRFHLQELPVIVNFQGVLLLVLGLKLAHHHLFACLHCDPCVMCRNHCLNLGFLQDKEEGRLRVHFKRTRQRKLWM